MSFCHAVATGDVATVRGLLARGEDPNQLEEGSPPIGWAMSMLSLRRPDTVRDVFACIELCLDAGALPDGPPTDSRNRRRRPETPLGSAVDQGRPEFVRLLLSAGADPNVPADRNGNTILHHACGLWGNRASGYEIVRLLLAAGADHAAQSNPPMNETPFGIAVCHAAGDGCHRLYALAALEVSVGLDPGAETNPTEADLSDSEGTSGSEG